jgi:hypothetical protein
LSLESCMRSLLSFLLLAMLAVASPSLAQERMFFDIPEQPLPSALESYSSVTGQAVIYDADLVAALRSNAVTGALLPKEALRLMIKGRNLSIVFGKDDVFALVPGPTQDVAASEMPDRRRTYFALVQHQIESTFCSQEITRPGTYRVALAFRVGSHGEVTSPRLLSSSGDVRRDGAILGLLGKVQVEEPPPSGLPQPVVMVISPKLPRLTGDCGQQ